MGISFSQKGDFKHTEKFLKRAQKGDFFKHLETYGEMGVAALASATPVDSGLTASSWYYEIHAEPDDFAIYWKNRNDSQGWFNVAIGIQYGHATRNGGWIQGRDYINPVIRPIFEKIAETVWREVQKP